MPVDFANIYDKMYIGDFMKETIKIENKGEVKLIAHRGLSGIMTENTVGAFEKAAEHSYYGIETDVHLTLDGKFILFHDDTTKRLTNKELIIEKTNYADLKALKINPTGEDGEPDLFMPDLADFFNICKGCGKKAVLEIKNSMPKEALIKLCEEIKGIDYFDNTIFISFYFSNLKFIRKTYKEANIQFLLNRRVPFIPAFLKFYKMDIDIDHTLLNKKKVKAFHKKGIKVNCWTCDDKKRAQELISFGVDYITTNILE